MGASAPGLAENSDVLRRLRGLVSIESIPTFEMFCSLQTLAVDRGGNRVYSPALVLRARRISGACQGGIWSKKKHEARSNRLDGFPAVEYKARVLDTSANQGGTVRRAARSLS